MGDSFHIRHQVQPDFLLSTLLGVSKALSQEDLLSFVQSMGFRPKLLAEQLRWGERLGLLKRREKTAIGPVDLTSSGKALSLLASVRPSLAYEFLHLLHFSLWNREAPESNRFSWTYRTLCEEILRAGAFNYDRRKIAQFLIERAYGEFGLDESVSLSPGTVRGAMQWLSKLNPPVFEDNRVHLRVICPPETLIMAVQHYYREHNLQVGDHVEISEEGRASICEACLLEPAHFGSMAREAALAYDVLEWTGAWGEFLRLRSEVSQDYFI